jgi:hypothetical protein
LIEKKHTVDLPAVLIVQKLIQHRLGLQKFQLHTLLLLQGCPWEREELEPKIRKDDIMT